jgi:nucleotide-binding universal stress UspA family protein
MRAHTFETILVPVDFAEGLLGTFVRSTLGDSADSVEVRVIEALPADGIRQLASQTDVDLIVMGTHGRSGLDRWMLGRWLSVC